MFHILGIGTERTVTKRPILPNIQIFSQKRLDLQEKNSNFSNDILDKYQFLESHRTKS